MNFDLLSFLGPRSRPLPWWGYIVVALVLTHVTIASVTIYLHRCQAHRGLDLHPAVSHFFRFWLWLTTGMVTKEWVAIHRKHHAKVETRRRPAQPADARHQTGVLARRRALSRRIEELSRRSKSTASARPTTGWSATSTRPSPGKAVGLMLVLNLVLFGPIGATIWAVQMVWIPVTAAGIINGIGHYLGLSQLLLRRREPQHRSVGHPDRRRRAAQQPPRLRHLGQALVALVRVRHRLDVHPHARDAGPREGAQGGAATEVRPRQAQCRPRDAAGGHHPSLCGADELCLVAEAGVCARSCVTARTRTAR